MPDSAYHTLRKALFEELLRIKIIQDTPGRNQQLFVQDLAKQISQHHSGLSLSTLWEAIYELFSQGIIVPVSLAVFRNPHIQGTNLWGNGYYSITDYGARFLESAKSQPDPYDAVSILEALRKRKIANETVEAYIPEAVKSFGANAFRGVFVLIGVAAESLSEEIYTAFEGHLTPSHRATFLQSLNVKTNSAEARWKALINRFPHHHSVCIGDELNRRFTNVFEPQLKLFKHNRDDAAHRRATLIDRDTAHAALVNFVPFGMTAADVVQALAKPCEAVSPT